MDLALYEVNAVLVEGRSVRDVAAATGRSKSWVHRHVVRFRPVDRPRSHPLGRYRGRRTRLARPEPAFWSGESAAESGHRVATPLSKRSGGRHDMYSGIASATMIGAAASSNARWEKACGKLPRCYGWSGRTPRRKGPTARRR